MVYEFEGRTEKEAIDLAAEKLGLEKNEFDVEILESQRSGLFKKGYVKIRIHTNSPVKNKEISAVDSAGDAGTAGKNRFGINAGKNTGIIAFGDTSPLGDLEEKLVSFTQGLIERMGYSCKVVVLFREGKKIGLKIESEHSSIIIGKKGKTLDAIQLLVSIYAGRLGNDDIRVILDSENYRIRREESLVRMAYKAAERVRESRSSILLEPMNPFDRRLIHTTLNDIADVETKSEGDGLYKQVRIYFRGSR